MWDYAQSCDHQKRFSLSEELEDDIFAWISDEIHKK